MTSSNPTSVEQIFHPPRSIAKIIPAIEQSEGDGARVRRSIGTPQLRRFAPFLMLDHFFLTDGAGFPDHPHRGQETITYQISGATNHEDFTGSAGTIQAGDLQFMTAGRGIVHAEIPSPQPLDGAANVGLQLWVDLPAHLKQCEPRYRDLRAKEIPVARPSDKVDIKVISGQSYGIDSVKDLAYTPVWLLHVNMRPGGEISQPLPKGWNSFIYTMAGNVTINNSRRVEKFNNIVLNKEGNGINISVPPTETETADFVILAGQPSDQPVVQYGPFVQLTEKDIYKTFDDYQNFRNGFERLDGWESKIGKEFALRRRHSFRV
ncbi:Pirin-1 [Arthrobotrys entomopaga]|nr:Pirin-1 [Arthrobotrys entomopaga]